MFLLDTTYSRIFISPAGPYLKWPDGLLVPVMIVSDHARFPTNVCHMIVHNGTHILSQILDATDQELATCPRIDLNGASVAIDALPGKDADGNPTVAVWTLTTADRLISLSATEALDSDGLTVTRIPADADPAEYLN